MKAEKAFKVAVSLLNTTTQKLPHGTKRNANCNPESNFHSIVQMGRKVNKRISVLKEELTLKKCSIYQIDIFGIQSFKMLLFILLATEKYENFAKIFTIK